MNRALLALGLCALLTACPADKAPRTQVMVVMDAQSQTRERASNVDFEVRTGTGPVEKWEVRLRQSITPGEGVDWPLEVALVPSGGDANRVYLAIATARDEDGEAIAQVRAIGGYQRAKTLSLLLLFEDSCLDKVDLCDPEQTCRRGACVDAHVGALPFYARDDAGEPLLIPFWLDGGVLEDAAVGTGGDPDAGHDAGHVSPGAACDTDSDCDDDDPCNGAETCAGSLCKKGTAFECPAIEQPCLRNVCMVSNGKPVCEARDADEGKSCRDGDESGDPETRCARDYECVAGACEPQVTEACDPSACETRAGCDAADGCVFTPKTATTDCNDGDACTQTDKCSGTDGTCAGVAYSCDDTVACTVDVCDGAGGCTNTTDDTRCGGPCKTGTCHATMNCLNVTFSQDFIDCSDSNAGTSPDLCYRGECLGGRQGAPSASCKLGDCECSGFGNVRDLQYWSTTSKYVGLIETAQNGGGGACTTGTVSTVYDVTRSALTAYGSSDTGYGGIAESASDLNLPYVITSTRVASADLSAQTVQWTGTTYGSAIAAQTPSITNFRGVARHATGSMATTQNSYFWIWGTDSTTSSTARLVRCHQCSTILNMGCASAALTCTDVLNNASSSLVSVLPYVGANLSAPYAGTLALTNYASGAVRKRIFEDGTGKDLVPTSIEADDADGAWSGLLRLSGTGQVLAFGSGSNSVRVCTDAANSGDTTCVPVTGLPNQSVRSYSRAERSGSAVLLLATNGTNNYLVMLATGLDPTTSNWREISIANSGTTTANAVAISPSSFMVLGKTGAVPYVWYWGPP